MLAYAVLIHEKFVIVSKSADQRKLLRLGKLRLLLDKLCVLLLEVIADINQQIEQVGVCVRVLL